MGLNIGIRISPKRGIRLTKSYSAGPFLFWLRKGKVRGSIRFKAIAIGLLIGLSLAVSGTATAGEPASRALPVTPANSTPAHLQPALSAGQLQASWGGLQ